MEEITKQVFIEEQYPGVTLGVINQPRGLIQIDAPPAPEDGRAWRAALMNFNSGPERFLINLDAHPDRTLGVRAMDCSSIAHEKTAQVFRNRPSTFKVPSEETGADWETISGLGGIRWSPPEISFTNEMTLFWGELTIVLQYRPGPSAGAIWVALPEEKVVFVGDAVLKNQPPFLATADLPAWIEALEVLQGADFRGYTVVGGRDGVVSGTYIKNQVAFLKDALKRLEKLVSKGATVDATESLVQPLLSNIKFPAAKQKQYSQRLRYGLQHYYTRHYHTNNQTEEE